MRGEAGTAGMKPHRTHNKKGETMRGIAVLAVATALLAGCATQAQKADEAFDVYKATLPEPNADYGSYPENYQELIKAYMTKTLKDPESARYAEFSTPRKEHAIANKRAIYGYSSCVLVNAKNSYGGYTGNQQFWFFFQNGQIVRTQNVTTGMNIIYIGRPINCQNG
jgi:hypothetical protein